jgi:AcrR family transcriptional regulator
MSSAVGTRRTRSAGIQRKRNGRLPAAAAPDSHMTRRRSTVPAPAQGLPAEIQRNRILSATIRSLEEVGYPDTSVARITSSARVSRRTFYELFPDRDACLLAAFEDVVAQIQHDLAKAELERLPWRERVRGGLWTILSFFEREPAMARVCIVQPLRGDAEILEHREALLSRLATVVDEGRDDTGDGSHATPLTAEGLVGASLTILYTRLLRTEREPLTDLLGELMALIVLPYLGPAAARCEQRRPAPAFSAEQLDHANSERATGDPFEGISMRLTYRTMRVLECVAAQPGASNRQVGVQAGVSDQGQISKLLSRLERLGLVANAGKARPKGEANAWELTPQGLQVTQTIGLVTGARQ